MSNPDLPYEIWYRILSFLRNPIPEARSRVPRREIRQQDLTSAVRTCKLFQSISEKLLYTSILTDQMGKLFPTTSAGLDQKRRLFAHTQNLFLEYSDKHPEVPYLHLFSKGVKGAWDKVGSMPGSASSIAACTAEVQSLCACMMPIIQGPTRKLLPKLHTVAIGSIYGGDDETWVNYNVYTSQHPSGLSVPSDIPGDNKSCADIFHQVAYSSNIRQLCVRGSLGPLHTLTTPSAGFVHPIYGEKTKFDLTSHISVEYPNFTIPFGSKVRYVSDTQPGTEWETMGKVMGQMVRSTNQFRKISPKSFTQIATDATDIDMFFSCVFGDSPEDLPSQTPAMRDRQSLSTMGNTIQTQLRRGGSGAKDKFRWYPSSDAAPCPCCGSLPPGVEPAS